METHIDNNNKQIMKLFQNPTVAWALALALFITSSASTCASSASPSGLGSTTITSMMGALIPHDKINALIAQAVVAALVSETSSDKATTLLVPTSLPAQGLLGGLPARIEIELDKLEIGGVTMPTLEVWRANTKSSVINQGNIKIYTAHRGSE